MELVWTAPALLLPVCVICRRHGIDGQSRTLIQGLMVLYAASVTSGAYLILKARLEREPDSLEKFWIALPLFASFSVAGRCIFGRLARLVVRSRRRPQQPKEPV